MSWLEGALSPAGLGYVTAAIAGIGVVASLATLSSTYRGAHCTARLAVVAIAVGLVWKIGKGVFVPDTIDLGETLIVSGLTALYLRRLWLDRTGNPFDFWR